MNFVDTHVHIDFFDNFDKILNEYERLQIYTIFVTMLPEIFEKHISLISSYRYVRLALGFHPQVSLEYNFNINLFKKYIKYTNYIGEIGIDLSSPLKLLHEKQITIFKEITKPLYTKGRLLSIHSKHAEKDVLSILKKNKVKHAIFHWYSGGISDLEKIIDAGYYFSVNSKMAQTDKGKKIIKSIPINRLLFETDAPFVKHNKQLILPSSISSLYEHIETSCEIKDFKNIVFNNFKTLLKATELERIQEIIN